MSKAVEILERIHDYLETEITKERKAYEAGGKDLINLEKSYAKIYVLQDTDAYVLSLRIELLEQQLESQN